MFKILKFLKKRELIFVLVSVVFIIVQVYFDLSMPKYMNEITQIVQNSAMDESSSSTEISEMVWNGLKMLGCTLCSIIATVISSYFLVNISTEFSARLRSEMYTKIQSFSNADINNFKVSSLITRTTKDVEAVENLIALGIQYVIKAPLLAVLAIKKISEKQWQLTAAISVTILIMLIVVLSLIRIIVKSFDKIQKSTDLLNHVTREHLSGIKVIRSFNSELMHEERFEKVNEEFGRFNLKMGRVGMLLNPFLMMIMNFTSIIVYWIGSHIISNSSVSEALEIFGDMIVFMSYGMQIVMAFVMLSALFIVIPQSIISIKRINEVLFIENSITEGRGVGKTSEKGTIEFRNVSFRYPNSSEDVISNISFKADRGETVAFIGSTGCGKTTLVNLAIRAYDTTKGTILIDGEDIRNYKKDELALKIGYVPQKAELLSGKLSDNVNFGDNNANEDEVIQALKIAQCENFINADDGWINKHISQNGSNLSGGQKQRVSIARAIARKSDIYIFDDSFSALDFKTDRLLRKNVKENLKDRTLLIIAQRIGTIIDADKIIVLDNGKIVGQGTHHELLNNCHVYMEMAQSQLREEDFICG